MAEEQKEAQKGYVGYFLIDSGLKVKFDVTEEEGGEEFSLYLYGNCEFPWEKGDSIWLGEEADYYILADRVIGWSIREYEVK